MKVNAIQCPICKIWVYSRTRHDMRGCPCKSIFIDGGRDYSKITYSQHLDKNKFKFRTFKIKATKNDLYIDFNKSMNKFGYIKPYVAERSLKRKIKCQHSK